VERTNSPRGTSGVHRRRTRPALSLPAIAVILAAALPAQAEEIRLFDNKRVYGLIDGLDGGGTLRVIDADGSTKQVKLDDVVSITYRGRGRRMIQSGTQDFWFVGGGRLRAQIRRNDGDKLELLTRTSGLIQLDVDVFTGFVALPVMGLHGRKALEMVGFDLDELDPRELNLVRASPFVDVLMDRRGSVYPGVVRQFEKNELAIDHENLLQVVPIKMLYVAGVRLADAARRPEPPWTTEVRVRAYTRDDSVLEGELQRIYLDRWFVKPRFDPKKPLDIDLQEIRVIQVINGRMQYLSQLSPVTVKESTVLAPPQPYKLDTSCQGDPIVIAGQQYPWGIGVHADSELTFKLGKRFKLFRSAIGIADQVKHHGSVVFQVLGDGKVLYTSPTVTSAEAEPRNIEVKIYGVDQLTLKVTDAGDLDLGDVANWGSARLLR